MKEKPWVVRTPFGTIWVVRFTNEAAAWRRVVRPSKRPSESEEVAKLRLTKAGWRVFHETVT